jgi:TIR domain
MAEESTRFRVGLERNLRIFISCANENLLEAQDYRKLFQKAGFIVHLYDENFYATPIQAVVKSQITECDFFLLLVSEHSASADRPWVSRELGQALATRAGNDGYRPIIMPVYCKGYDAAARIAEFPIRDFDTSALREDCLDLIELRAHDPQANPTSDTPRQLLSSMQVEIALVHEDIHSRNQLIDTGAVDLYHELFPDDQRAPLEDDLRWIFDADVDKPFPLSIPTSKHLPIRLSKWMGLRGTYRLKSYFFVLLRRGAAIGFAWVTYHRETRLLYGNYIGVQEQWRKGSLANPLMDQVQARVLKEFPECRGLVLEVEPFSFDEVERAVQLLEGGAAKSDEEHLRAKKLVRSFKRVWWYETCDRLQAKCIRDIRTRMPLVHTYPCMETDAPREHWPRYELPYWLLVCVPERVRRTDTAEDAWALWKRATEFSVLENMGKRTVRDSPEIAEKYWKYIVALQQRNVRRARTATRRKVEYAPVFGSERRKGGRARELYTRIDKLPFKINV